MEMVWFVAKNWVRKECSRVVDVLGASENKKHNSR